MLEISLLNVTITASEDIKANTFVTFTGSYPDAATDSILGVALTDAKSGETVAVQTHGLASVLVEVTDPVQDIDVGDALHVTASGTVVGGVAAGDDALVDNFKTALTVKHDHVEVIL